MILTFKTPDWSLPLFEESRYKGIRGGRGGGKSHFFAEYLIERMLLNKDFSSMCVREKLKSLTFSAKRLIENKISEYKLDKFFRVMDHEIRRRNGRGKIIFQGMQDHTADSIKSLEDFDCAWIEEAQAITKYSLSILLPTIRKEGSELLFSWNPCYENDPVERLFANAGALVTVNYLDNPFCSKSLLEEAERHRVDDPETFNHVWLGEFVSVTHAKVFSGRWIIDNFSVDLSHGEPLHGLDFGFSSDPSACVRVYVKDNVLFIAKEDGDINIEINDMAQRFKKSIPDLERYVIRADNSRPESISYLKKHGLPRIKNVEKWNGSLEDGITFLKSFSKIVIHPSCKKSIEEFKNYSYKVDYRTGDVLPDILDAHNHFIDAIRYAIEPLIKSKTYSLENVR